MGQITNSKLKTKTLSSTVNGFLVPKDLYATIRALVPKAPPEAQIEIYFEIPGGGNYSGTPFTFSDTDTIKFTVTWEEKE